MDATETTTRESRDAADGAPVELVPTLEALMFVSGEPITLRQIQGALPGVSRERLQAAMDLLAAGLAEPSRGLQVQEVAGGFRLVTKAEQDGYVRAFTTQKKKQRLSPAARETLTIIAYKQPITAPECTEIRGVDCGSAVKSLLERKLIRILGRKEVVGRPILYGTTREFLVLFGLKGLEELPTLEEFEDLATGMGVAGDAAAPPEAPVDASELRELQMAEATRAARSGEEEEGEEWPERAADGSEEEE